MLEAATTTTKQRHAKRQNPHPHPPSPWLHQNTIAPTYVSDHGSLHYLMVTVSPPSILQQHGFNEMPRLHHQSATTAPSVAHRHGFDEMPCSNAMASSSAGYRGSLCHPLPWLQQMPSLNHLITTRASSSIADHHGIYKIFGSIFCC